MGIAFRSANVATIGFLNHVFFGDRFDETGPALPLSTYRSEVKSASPVTTFNVLRRYVIVPISVIEVARCRISV
jgi:hypothetical protein